MADEQSGSPLRRWRPFYNAFGAIDDAIEAAGHPRAAFRDVRVRIVQLLRGAADDAIAEQLCAALDDAMAESLKTLRVAPVPHSALASTGLARTVGALGEHESARIRSLASDVVREWRAANVTTATAVKEELDKLAGDPIPRQGISTMMADGNARGSFVGAATTEVHEKVHKPAAKVLPNAATVSSQQKTTELKKPVVAHSENTQVKKPIAVQRENENMVTKKSVVSQSEKMEITKCKLREGYQEAYDSEDLRQGCAEDVGAKPTEDAEA